MSRYAIEIVVFICGAVVMAYELVASRILAPYLGTSTIVWTSVIGVILASLSLGYYLGGILADKKPTLINLGRIILVSSLFIALTACFHNILLKIISTSVRNLRISSSVSSVILFGPTSMLLGMVSPYAVRLKLNDLKNSGKKIGNLYALSTLGSIFGTFITGFYLLGILGSTKILVLLTLLLIVSGFIVGGIKLFSFKIFMIQSLIISSIYLSQTSIHLNVLADIDTIYSRIFVYDTEQTNTDVKQKIRILSYGRKSQSAMYLDSSNDLVFQYTKYYDLAFHFNDKIQKVLAIGAGAYSYPKHLLSIHPQTKLDVVEIDPIVTEIARKYFFLKDHPNLKIIHEDGRYFLNNTTSKYDAILIDAYKSDFELPYDLFTIEAARKIRESLNNQGILIVNIASSLNGSNSQVVKSIFRTFVEVFPNTHLLRVYQTQDYLPQNIMMISHKDNQKPNMISSSLDFQSLLDKKVNIDYSQAPILTDDFSPLDFFYHNWNTSI